MTSQESSAAHTLDVLGARLYYQLRGRGPLLLLIGAPMGSVFFAGLADQFATDHTVLTYDPRGISRSVLDGPAGEDTPELRADDVRRLIIAAGGGPADLFGNSGGALTGLALVQRHPELVRTLVAHEPPVTELLADAEQYRAWSDELYRTYREQGAEVAMGRFFAAASIDPGPVQHSADAAVLAATRRNNEYFLEHMLASAIHFRPELAALRATPTRIVIGAGSASVGQIAHRTAVTLAEQLGAPLVDFPGDHDGFLSQPVEFAAVLARVLDERSS